jgi:hypothetical protein
MQELQPQEQVENKQARKVLIQFLMDTATTVAEPGPYTELALLCAALQRVTQNMPDDDAWGHEEPTEFEDFFERFENFRDAPSGEERQEAKDELDAFIDQVAFKFRDYWKSEKVLGAADRRAEDDSDDDDEELVDLRARLDEAGSTFYWKESLANITAADLAEYAMNDDHDDSSEATGEDDEEADDDDEEADDDDEEADDDDEEADGDSRPPSKKAKH